MNSIFKTLTTGNVTSPNYPGQYPSNLKKTETIQVEEGLILSLQFTGFNIKYHYTCDYHHLTITDGDGTTLMEKSCGNTLPADIISRTNIVKLLFITDGSYNQMAVTWSGWSVSWSAVTPGNDDNTRIGVCDDDDDDDEDLCHALIKNIFRLILPKIK